MIKAIKKLLIIAYSTGYEAGHQDTVESRFCGNGRSDAHDEQALEWVNDADEDGTFERDVDCDL